MRVPALLQSPGMAATRPGWARGEAERCPKLLPRLGQGSDCLSGERQGEGFLVLRSLPRSIPSAVGGSAISEIGVSRRERASYLARMAGVVEGVDVLGAEAHHPAVDAIEIGSSGGVARIAAQLCRPRGGLCLVARDRRPQEPGQRAEQRQPRAVRHGGRLARPEGPRNTSGPRRGRAR